MSIRDANRVKKRLTCLRCGRPMWTDRCHRICPRCRRRRAEEPVRRPVSVWLPGNDENLDFGPSRGAGGQTLLLS